MEAMVTIPLDLYKLLESRCREKTIEFKLLKSGVIDGDRKPIRCDREEAEQLVDRSEHYVPGATARISVTAETGE